MSLAAARQWLDVTRVSRHSTPAERDAAKDVLSCLNDPTRVLAESSRRWLEEILSEDRYPLTQRWAREVLMAIAADTIARMPTTVRAYVRA